MNVLFIGTDRKLFEEGSGTWKRHAGLGVAHPLATFTSIVFSARPHGFKEKTQVASNVAAHPTNSSSRLLYGIDALALARTLPRPDVVSAQDPFETGLAALLIARHFKVPLVVEAHTDFVTPSFARHSFINRVRLVVASFVLRRAAAGYAVSKSLRDAIVRAYDLTIPFAVLPIHVDVSRFASLPRTKGEGVSLLWVGRLEKEKDPLRAIEALSAVRASGIDAKLTMVGTGRLWGAVRRKVRALGLSAHVQEVEGWADVAPYYAKADALLVTSAYEGYGMVIIEALAAGVPVFAADVGIAREAGAHIAKGNYAHALAAWLKELPSEGTLALPAYKDEAEYFSKIGAFYERAAKPGLLVVCEAMDLDHPVLGFFHRWVQELAGSFSAVSVICLGEGRHELPENVQVYSLGKESGHSRLTYLVRFFLYIGKLRRSYDAVHVHMNQEYVLLGGLVWRAWGKGVFLWRNFHTGDLGTDLAAALSTAVFYTSASSYTARFKNAKRMPVGVDVTTFSPGGERAARSVLSVGRIAPVKRLEVLLGAVELLASQGKEVQVDIVGDALPKDAAYRASLQERAVPGVSFHPGVSNDRTPDLYRTHEVFVNLSPSGMYDKTIIEAASCGALSIAASADWAKAAGEQLSFDGTAKDLADKLEAVLFLPEGEKEALRASSREAASRESLAALKQQLTRAILDRTV